MNLKFSGVNRSSYTNSANLLKEGNNFKLCLKLVTAFSYNKINVNVTPFALRDTCHVLEIVTSDSRTTLVHALWNKQAILSKKLNIAMENILTA